MIPALGLIIGLYIITRYVDMARAYSVRAKVLFAILIFVTVCVIWNAFIVAPGNGATQ